MHLIICAHLPSVKGDYGPLTVVAERFGDHDESTMIHALVDQWWDDYLARSRVKAHRAAVEQQSFLPWHTDLERHVYKASIVDTLYFDREAAKDRRNVFCTATEQIALSDVRPNKQTGVAVLFVNATGGKLNEHYLAKARRLVVRAYCRSYKTPMEKQAKHAEKQAKQAEKHATRYREMVETRKRKQAEMADTKSK